MQNNNGHLNLKINNFNIEQIEANINTILKYKTEWNLKDYYIDVYWK